METIKKERESRMQLKLSKLQRRKKKTKTNLPSQRLQFNNLL